MYYDLSLSLRYALAQPAEAAAILVKHNPTLDEGLMLAHWEASRKAIDTSFVREHGYGHATDERLQRSIELVEKAFGLKSSLSAGNVYADGFMPR